MGFNCGIVGLPNVGKSTLFNALTQTQSAQSANFPFCTIEPNVGRVAVMDERIDTLADIAQSQTKIYAQLEFVDIAGLVKGASKGEGLGNQFLSHIRQTHVIVHVLRCFEDDDITHVEGHIDPIRDAQVIETELLLADLENVTNRRENLKKKAKSGDQEAQNISKILDLLLPMLEEGKPARELILDDREQKRLFDHLQLLTAKSVLYVCNVAEQDAVDGNEFSRSVEKMAAQKGAPCVVISAEIESDIAQLEDPQDQKAFLDELGLKETGLNQMVRHGYGLLDLMTFFTVGPKECRGWTVPRGVLAPQAAGAIHTDFQRGFIKAQTISYEDYVACQGESGAKNSGKARLEGKTYVVEDGDVMLFKFNV